MKFKIWIVGCRAIKSLNHPTTGNIRCDKLNKSIKTWCWSKYREENYKKSLKLHFVPWNKKFLRYSRRIKYIFSNVYIYINIGNKHRKLQNLYNRPESNSTTVQFTPLLPNRIFISHKKKKYVLKVYNKILQIVIFLTTPPPPKINQNIKSPFFAQSLKMLLTI